MTDQSDTNGLRQLRRWRRQPEARPQQILDAAFRLFGSRGLHGATLEQVAREAGISKGTIYLYFPDKASLFTAMMQARVNGIMPPEARVRPSRDATARSQLRRVGQRLYRFFCTPAFLALYRTIIGEAPQFPDAAATLYREGILPANRRLAAVFQAGIERGEFRRVDPLVAARAFVGMLQVFAVSQELLGGQRILPLAADRVVSTVMDLLFHGLLAPSTPRPQRTGVRQ